MSCCFKSQEIPSIKFSQALKKSTAYEIEGGILYLTNGTQRKYKVKIDKNHPHIQGSINEFFNALNSANAPKFKNPNYRSFSLQDFMNQCIGTKVSLCKFISTYAFSHGFKSFELGNDKLYPILQEIIQEKNFNPLNSDWGISIEGSRRLIAKVLKDQEDAILAQIPQQTLQCPKLLRSYLLGLLQQKGLSYETAINQFDWSLGRPKESPVEGTYVIAKLIAQVEVWAALRAKKGAENFPFQEVWRFSIDGSKEEFGPYIFENEPFYILSSLRGLKEILESQALLCQKTYETYANTLLNNPPIFHHHLYLNWRDDDFTEAFFQAKMSPESRSFEVSVHLQDKIGLDDLRDRVKKANKAIHKDKNDEEYWLAHATGFTFTEYQLGSKTTTTCTLIANRIFLGCEQMLTQAKTPGERLMAYIWRARELEVTHQLPDGNGRTSIATLIKAIAEDKDLPNYIPENPNILDFQAPEAILRQVYSGMVRFKALSQERSEKMIGVEKLIDQAKVRGQSWEVVHKRAQLPKDLIKKLVEEDRLAMG